MHSYAKLLFFISAWISSRIPDTVGCYPAECAVGPNGSIYKLLPQLLNWRDATQACREEGGTLPRIVLEDSSSYQFLENFMRLHPHKEGFWLSLNDRERENRWKYDNGESFTGTFRWATKPDIQPDNLLNQDCVWVIKRYDYKWDDYQCHKKVSVVCEIDCSDPTCNIGPNGYVYKLLPQLLNWDDAVQACYRQGGSLPRHALKDTSVYGFLEKFMRSNADRDGFWLSLNDKYTENYWKYDNGQGHTGVYNWIPPPESQPDNFGIQNCVLVNRRFAYQWDDFWCSREASVICEIDCSSMNVAIGPNGYQYKLLPQVWNWEDAAYECRMQRGTLPRKALEAPTAYAFLDLFMRFHNKKDYWLPLNDKSDESQWIYEDGESFAGTYHWVYDHPPFGIQPNNDRNQDCVRTMRSYGYQWDDYWCNQTASVICEIGCFSREYVIGPNGYFYNLLPQMMNWEHAAEACRNVGGTLPIEALSDDYTYQFLDNCMRSHPEKVGFWLSLTDRMYEGVWKHEKSRRRFRGTYRWATSPKRQPDDLGNQDCAWVIARFGYKWDDYWCRLPASVICERDPSVV